MTMLVGMTLNRRFLTLIMRSLWIENVHVTFMNISLVKREC